MFYLSYSYNINNEVVKDHNYHKELVKMVTFFFYYVAKKSGLTKLLVVLHVSQIAWSPQFISHIVWGNRWPNIQFD